ncbi:MAG: gluconokinase, GntK/IdnK-type [Porticoccaceae bacterium]|jgi:gluconokinase|nr:gluconokinase, GntK/IdnK-type [Porticoccaceae bacterium]
MLSLENIALHRLEPLLVVVMGVSGTGKSTLASEIAQASEFTYLDADSFHSSDAIAQMSQGIPLTDAQREPWIERIHSQLSAYRSEKKHCVLAYSGLKQQHRQVIFSAYKHSVGVLLDADLKLITKRLSERSDHFMSPQLLTSQIAEMEPFDNKTPLLKLDSADTLDQLLVQFAEFMAPLN